MYHMKRILRTLDEIERGNVMLVYIQERSLPRRGESRSLARRHINVRRYESYYEGREETFNALLYVKVVVLMLCQITHMGRMLTYLSMTLVLSAEH